MAQRNSREDKGKWVADFPKATKRPPVRIPHVDTAALIEEHKLTLIGRVTNPSIQKTKALVDFFLQHWRVKGNFTGRDLGPNLFQFKFETEQDLQSILSQAPYHFKRWMLILQRWEPIVSDNFSALIPFWITIHGIPLHYWADVALDAIGNDLGSVEDFDVDRGRIRVLINGLKPLEMCLDISLPSGEIKQEELEYENLEKHCFACYSLTHEKENCPTLRAQANANSSAHLRMGISQTRTLDRLDADKRRQDARHHARAAPEGNSKYRSNDNSSQWQRSSSRTVGWTQGKNVRYDYGVRRDPNYQTGIQISEISNPHRMPAKTRLSFSRDNSTSTQAHKTEWRPVASGTQRGTPSKSLHSIASHTPSPRPQREGGSLNLTASSEPRQRSGKECAPSQERRSALDRLSLSKERIPLLQDGVANAESGRLQEVEIKLLDDIISPTLHGRSNIPSGSRNPAPRVEESYDPNQDRSPIRSLSEDRLHVSLRLGPLAPDTENDMAFPSLNQAQTTNLPPTKPHTTRKRQVRSPTQGVSVKKRRVTKTQNSPEGN